jgi:hypothetical protein
MNGFLPTSRVGRYSASSIDEEIIKNSKSSSQKQFLVFMPWNQEKNPFDSLLTMFCVVFATAFWLAYVFSVFSIFFFLFSLMSTSISWVIFFVRPTQYITYASSDIFFFVFIEVVHSDNWYIYEKKTHVFYFGHTY